MPFKFNPFSGNFDQTGSGGGASYIDGEEATYNDLSLDAGVAPLNSAWLVRSSSGIWPFNKPGGIYIRTATGGASRDADYTYAGTMPDVFSDAVLTIYDEASTTRTGQFNLGSVTAGQNRVLTWPDANGTIARTQDFASPPAIGNTTRNTVAATTVSATGAITGAVAGTTSATSGCNGFQIPVPAAGGASAVGMYGTFSAGNARAVIFGANTTGSTSTIAEFSSGGLTVGGSTVAFYYPGGLWAGVNGAFAVTGTLSLNNSLNAIITADAANIIAIRNGAAAQDLRIYGQSTTTTNFERLSLKYNSTATAFQIGTEKGTSGSARPLEFQTDGVTRMTVGATGIVTVSANQLNALTISGSNSVGFNGAFLQNTSNGASASTGFTAQNNSTAALVTRVYSSGVTGVSVFGTALANFAGVFADGAAVAGLMVGTANSTPIILGTNNIERVRITSGGQVTFGGTDATFPALKRSSTTLQVRLADDTAFAPLECADLTLNGNLTASTRNIVTDTTTGTKIGTDPLQKIGFFDKTPVVRPSAVADATDAASVITQLNALLSRMRDLGLIAT